MRKNLIVLNNDKVFIAMANKGYSTKTLCENAKIFEGTFRRMLNGNPLSTDTVGKIANALDVRVEDLI